MFAHRPLSDSFLWFFFCILYGNPKKELLRGLWVYQGAPKNSVDNHCGPYELIAPAESPRHRIGFCPPWHSLRMP